SGMAEPRDGAGFSPHLLGLILHRSTSPNQDRPTLPAVARFIASFMGTGLILRRLRGTDPGSGTVGSAVALVIALALAPIGSWAQALALVTATVASLVFVRPFSSSEGDPAWVVIDEAAGTFLATLGLAAAENLPGSLGVTADDLVAGLYGLAAGWIATFLLS